MADNLYEKAVEVRKLYETMFNLEESAAVLAKGELIDPVLASAFKSRKEAVQALRSADYKLDDYLIEYNIQFPEDDSVLDDYFLEEFGYIDMPVSLLTILAERLRISLLMYQTYRSTLVSDVAKDIAKAKAGFYAQRMRQFLEYTQKIRASRRQQGKEDANLPEDEVELLAQLDKLEGK